MKPLLVQTGILFGVCVLGAVSWTFRGSAAEPVVTADPLDCVVEPKATIELGSPEEGLVAEIAVDRGDNVNKGDIVAKLDDKLQRLNADIARLRADNDLDVRTQRARLIYQQKESARATQLHEKKIVADSRLDEAAAERRVAELALDTAILNHKIAQVEYAQAEERLDRRSLKSPVDGVVTDVTMEPGEYAHEQSPIMTIAEIHPLHVEVFVPVALYGTVGVGSRARVMLEEPIGGVHQARVTVVDKVFDAASQTFGVRLELPNPAYELPAGLTCEVQFIESEAAASIEVDAEVDVLQAEQGK